MKVLFCFGALCLAVAYGEMCFEASQCTHEICDTDYSVDCVFGECTCSDGTGSGFENPFGGAPSGEGPDFPFSGEFPDFSMGGGPGGDGDGGETGPSVGGLDMSVTVSMV